MPEPDQIETGALVGAFYWSPAREPAGRISWRLLTCHDLRRWDGISHRELWPSVLDHLAATWDKDPAVLRRRLGDHYYALPRGRVTHPRGRYLILHGNDAPVAGLAWKRIMIDRYRLDGMPLATPHDEHERTLREDVLSFEESFGIDLNLPRG